MVKHFVGGSGGISLKRGRLVKGAYTSARELCDSVANSVSNFCLAYFV